VTDYGCYLTKYTRCKHTYCKKRDSQKSTEWLSIIWKNRMVEINGKGKIRNAKRQKKNTR